MSRELGTQYLAALNETDLDKVLSLFTRDALVVSPLYGEMAVEDFYTELFADTNRSETKFLNLFESKENGGSMGLHFHYKWTLKNGEVVNFEVVDVFELTSDGQRFKKLTIIYDTYPIRDEHQKSCDSQRDV